MDKLTGHGRPHAHLVGEVGQHYEDLDTGDIYECRIASKYSPTHGWPVGGYVWELRAKGEDIQDGLYGGGSGSSGGVFTVKISAGAQPDTYKADHTLQEIIDADANGMFVRLNYSGEYYYLNGAASTYNGANFFRVFVSGTSVYVKGITIDPSETIYVRNQITLTST